MRSRFERRWPASARSTSPVEHGPGQAQLDALARHQGQRVHEVERTLVRREIPEVGHDELVRGHRPRRLGQARPGPAQTVGHDLDPPSGERGQAPRVGLARGQEQARRAELGGEGPGAVLEREDELGARHPGRAGEAAGAGLARTPFLGTGHAVRGVAEVERAEREGVVQRDDHRRARGERAHQRPIQVGPVVQVRDVDAAEELEGQVADARPDLERARASVVALGTGARQAVHAHAADHVVQHLGPAARERRLGARDDLDLVAALGQRARLGQHHGLGPADELGREELRQEADVHGTSGRRPRQSRERRSSSPRSAGKPSSSGAKASPWRPRGPR